jgi:transposase
MSDGKVRKWVRIFNEGRENVHDEARSGCPYLVNDDLVRKVNERERDDRRFTISALSSDLKDSMTLSVVFNIAGGRIL